MNRQFVALSGLAMILIVLNHAVHMSLEFPAELGYALVSGWPRFLLTLLQSFGVFAVPVFLFISGSFVAYAASAASRTASPISLKFIWSGLRHILWPYLLWSVIFYGVIYLQYGQQFSPLGYAKNLIVGYPFHFVPLLMLFYIVSPLLIPLARRYGALLLIATGLVQLALLNIREPGMFLFEFPAFTARLFPPVIGNSFADWGIYFPMGLVFSLHARALKPYLLRWRWAFVAATVIIFVLGLLHVQGLVTAPWARFLCPVPLLFVIPVVERRAIPAVAQLEMVGKRSYGLYLTHLIVIDLLLVFMRFLFPTLLNYQLLLVPILFSAGVALPLLLMNVMSQRAQARKVYRYVFG